jgi:serine/threonine protein kinase
MSRKDNEGDNAEAPSQNTVKIRQHVTVWDPAGDSSEHDAHYRDKESWEPQVGQRLGKCVLESIVGRGGSCTIFRARHESLDAPVAVKVLLPDESAHWQRSFLQLKSEAHLLARLSHPHIVRVLDFEADASLPYLVLELIEGGSLDDRIHKQGRLAPEQATAIILQAAEGLSAMWKLGAVHRDVKPANILLTAEGAAKLADLGQAVFPVAASPEVVGTPAYLAPEQFLAPQAVDFRADIYGLGATLYTAVTGQEPFTGRSCREVLLHQVRDMPRPPDLVVPELDRHLSKVILTMLAKDPADRYSGIQELRAALEHRSLPLRTTGQRPGKGRGEKVAPGVSTYRLPNQRKLKPDLPKPRRRSIGQCLAQALHLDGSGKWLL